MVDNENLFANRFGLYDWSAFSITCQKSKIKNEQLFDGDVILSQHERGLLVVGSSFLVIIFWGAFLSSKVLETPLPITLFSALRSSWWGLIIFGSFGLLGLYYELTVIDRNLRVIEAVLGKNKDPFAYRTAIVGGLCFIVLALLLSLPPYLLKNEDLVLDICYYLMIIGTIFIFLVFWMFVGAIIARIRRDRGIL